MDSNLIRGAKLDLEFEPVRKLIETKIRSGLPSILNLIQLGGARLETCEVKVEDAFYGGLELD